MLKHIRQGLRWSRKISNLSQLIENCSRALALLDGLEEKRSLSTIELNFRVWFNNTFFFFLYPKEFLWKQCSTAQWVALGDENTKIFHAFATRNYRRNFIASLKVDKDIVVSYLPH